MCTILRPGMRFMSLRCRKRIQAKGPLFRAIWPRNRPATNTLTRRSLYLRRLAGTVEDVRLNEPNLRRRDVLRERRHSSLSQCAASDDLLELLVRSRRGIAQIRHGPAAHHLCAVAARAKRGKKYAALLNLSPGCREMERWHRNRLHHSLIRR